MRAGTVPLLRRSSFCLQRLSSGLPSVTSVSQAVFLLSPESLKRSSFSHQRLSSGLPSLTSVSQAVFLLSPASLKRSSFSRQRLSSGRHSPQADNWLVACLVRVRMTCPSLLRLTGKGKRDTTWAMLALKLLTVLSHAFRKNI